MKSCFGTLLTKISQVEKASYQKNRCQICSRIKIWAAKIETSWNVEETRWRQSLKIDYKYLQIKS